MEPAATPAPSTGFAGMLARLAVPERKFPPQSELISEADWLEDDVAVISYESALKSRARRWGVDPIADESLTGTDDGVVIGEGSARTAQPAPVRAPDSPPSSSRLSITEADVPVTVHDPSQSKRVRITIRMSEAEYALIRDRAAEAGLAVSAYLRTCTAEIETLRAQVKEMLAQLRQSASGPDASEPAAPRRQTPARWLAHLWPRTAHRAQGRPASQA
jgi:mobilization protein NikA